MKKLKYEELPVATRAAIYVISRNPVYYDPTSYSRAQMFISSLFNQERTPKEWMEVVKIHGTWTDDVETELFGLMFAEE